MKTKIKNLIIWSLLQSAQWRYRLALLLTITDLAGCSWDHVEPDVCFEGEVLPIFVTYCSATGCHNAQDQAQGYDLTDYQSILHGTKPKNFSDSRVFTVLDTNDPKRMPPLGHAQLSSPQVLTIKTWAKLGAPNTQHCGKVVIDTLGPITYSGDIAPMMQANCTGCHSGRNAVAGLDLSDFNIVKENALMGKLQGSISHDPNYLPMPPRGLAISMSNVDQLDKWVAEGCPNN